MTKHRIEHDFLGSVAVPVDVFYGGQTMRAVENYPISGLRTQGALIKAYGWLKLACVEANMVLGMLPKRTGRAIARAAADVAHGLLDDQFVVDVYQAGAGVSFHMNVNEVIANRAIWYLTGRRTEKLGDYRMVHPNDHVNCGQSTNDTYPAALRVAALLLLEELNPALVELERAFTKKGREFAGIVKAGRTHLQDAVPIRLGHEFAAYGVAIRQAHRQIEISARGLEFLGIGGSAVGTGLNAHPRFAREAVKRLATHTGLKLRVAGDLHAAMQSQFPVSAVSGALRNLALELIRIANDLRLLASGPTTGLNEITLPALQPGSSIMPGKVNPVMAELLDMVAFQVIGCDTAVALAVQAGQLELNVMMPVMAWNLLHSIDILKNTCRVVARRCVLGIRANREVCERYAASSPALATALAPVLGYERTAEVVKKALSSGRTIAEICAESKLLSRSESKRLLDPRRMSQARAPKARHQP